MSAVRLAWQRIETWLSVNAPDMLELLPAGAPLASLEALEVTLGIALPVDLRESLQCHDGSGDLWLHEYGCFNSVAQIRQWWEMFSELWGDGSNDDAAAPRGFIKAMWWNQSWIPVTDCRNGDCAAIDLDPPSQAPSGQVFFWLNAGGPRDVLASSWTQLMQGFALDLETGKYRRGTKSPSYLEQLDC
jgi:cell wall assembly regulator SMI1